MLHISTDSLLMVVVIDISSGPSVAYPRYFWGAIQWQIS